ncbi:MAG: RNA methyltransferase [Alphaproteobacteria bacterium]
MSEAGDLVIILVRPQLAENIGMAARAMANCGLSGLRIVSPRSPWTEEMRQRAQAAGGRGGGVAGDILLRAECFDSLTDALADRHYVWASSARKRDFTQIVQAPEVAARDMHAACCRGYSCGVLFGPERTGLENDEIVRAEKVICVPLAEGAHSLNLAQAVLLVSWCFWRCRSGTDSALLEGGGAKADPDPAHRVELDGFLARLDHDLCASGYYPPTETADAMRRSLVSFFVRATPSAQEIRSLEGVLRALAERRAENRQHKKQHEKQHSKTVAEKPPSE